MIGAHDVTDIFERAIVDEQGAKQSLLGLEIVGQNPETLRLQRGRGIAAGQSDEIVGDHVVSVSEAFSKLENNPASIWNSWGLSGGLPCV